MWWFYIGNVKFLDAIKIAPAYWCKYFIKSKTVGDSSYAPYFGLNTMGSTSDKMNRKNNNEIEGPIQNWIL